MVETFWTQFTTFVTNMWTAISSSATAIGGNDVLALFVFMVPFFSIVVGTLLSLIGKRRRRRR